jgi:hypothetical protein
MGEKDQPIDMAVAMDAAREFLTPEKLAMIGETLDDSLTEAQREEIIDAILEEFNHGVNELYQSKLGEKIGGDDS